MATHATDTHIDYFWLHSLEKFIINPIVFPGKKTKICRSAAVIIQHCWMKLLQPKLDGASVWVLLQQTLKTDQFTHSNWGLICTYPNRLLHEYCLILTFPFHLLSALFMFYFCCAVCCQHICQENMHSEKIIYRASVNCIPKRNDGPLAKDLSESRLFTSETVAESKYAGQSTIYHCYTPYRKILHHQH